MPRSDEGHAAALELPLPEKPKATVERQLGVKSAGENPFTAAVPVQCQLS